MRNQKPHETVPLSSSTFKNPTWGLELGQEDIASAQAAGGSDVGEVSREHFCGARLRHGQENISSPAFGNAHLSWF